MTDAEFAVALAQEAGEITLKYFRQQSLTMALKADGSFVTAADQAAEKFLREQITRRFPEDAILGEEEGEHAGESGRRWIIDPIDGTYSFVHGVPLYGVLLALEMDDEISVGVANLPALGELLWAARGQGCFWNGERARVSKTDSLGDALVLTTDVASAREHGRHAAVASLQAASKKSRTWGDCYGHVLVATGRAEVMLDPVMNLWDCAALLPIVEEAGGTFTDWKGAKTARGGNAISTNGALFGTVMSTVKASGC